MEWALPAVAILCVFSLFFAAVAMLWAAQVKIDVEAFKRSTHQVQFVPVDPKDLTDDKTLSDTLDDDDDGVYQGTIDSLPQQKGGRPLI